MLSFDRKRMHQVMENLVNNAIKYTYRGEEILVAFERVGQG